MIPAKSRPTFTEVFVGRTGELAELEHALERACTGSGGLAFLTGEPGIGKTRTAEELAAHAVRKGLCVLWGRCHEGEECPPYGPWTAALRAYARSTDAATLRELAGGGMADIAVMLPELSDARERPRLPSDDGEQLLFHSLFSLLRAASLRVPLVVILDNLHRADASSLRFLRHISHDIADNRLLVLGTCRNPVEMRLDPLAVTMEVAVKTRGFLRLHLEGLSREETRALIAGTLKSEPAPGIVDALHARTEGNPLFLLELTRHMAAAPRGGAVDRLPEGIRQAIGRRVDRLTPSCVRVLSAAAVLGRTFSRDVLRGISLEMSADEVNRCLREARDASLVSEEDTSMGTCRFVHSLVRETLLEGIPADGLTRLHIDAARIMGRLCESDPGERAQEILAHLAAGARSADPDALARWTLLAAEHALARYAPDHALTTIDRSLDILSRMARAAPARVAPLWRCRGQTLTDLQSPEAARDSLVRAFEQFLAAGDPASAVDVALCPALTWESGGMWIGGQLFKGITELRERAFSLVGPDSTERAWLQIHRGSRADFSEALACAHNRHDERLELAALAGLAYHELLACDFTACARCDSNASALAERVPDLTSRWVLSYSRYYLCMFTGDPKGTADAIQGMFEIARRSHGRRWLMIAHRCAADFDAHRGRWNDSREHAARAMELLEGAGRVFNHLEVLGILLRIELQTGHLKAAGALQERLEVMRQAPVTGDIRKNVLGARVTEDASLLAVAPRDVEPPSTDGPLSFFVTGPLIRAGQLAALHRDAAAAACRKLLRPWRGTFQGASLDALMGSLCVVLGRLDDAIGHFEDGLSFCRRAGYSPEAAWICRDCAEARVSRGAPADRARAEQLMREGLALCRSLDMTPLKKQILAALRRLGGAAARSAVAPDGLTDREIDVLRLMAAGYTNAEIAGRLFVSPLTIARHVHNLLDKTGMSNRAEAVAYAARRGMLEG